MEMLDTQLFRISSPPVLYITSKISSAQNVIKPVCMYMILDLPHLLKNTDGRHSITGC
jgi:hypothetical protein